jgi:succinyl-diaminopimelate desuccinylase
MMTDVRADVLKMTIELCKYPSTLDHPDQLKAVIDYTVAQLKDLPRGTITHFNSNNKPAIVYSLRGNKHAKLILNAHLDVVPARTAQFEPFEKDGRLYCRGSQDMKGAAAILIRLAQELAQLPEPPDVNFQFVTDEEIGGMHGTNYILNEGFTCDFFITAEPTDLNICNLHKGASPIDVIVHGVPAHGSRPWLGRNPLHTLRDGLIALEKAYPTPDEEAFVTTCVPTIINGGNAGNRIMEELVMHLDIRRVPNESSAEVLAKVSACFPEHCTVKLMGDGVGLNTDQNDPAVQQLAAIVRRVTGLPGHFYREHFGTDARFYSSKGIPAVCCGPIGAGLHSDEEWVDIASLSQTYAVFKELSLTYAR